MSFWNQNILNEDIPLIDNPSPTVRATSSSGRGSICRRSEPFQDSILNSESVSIRRKPVPTREHDPVRIPRRQFSRHTGYSAISEFEETQYDHIGSTNDGEYTAIRPGIKMTALVQSFGQAEKANWLPYALRLPWLASTMGFGMLAVGSVVGLHYKSLHSNGVLTDSGSSTLYFAWRFMPTLVAVIFVTMLMIILDAVKRTEALARLKSSKGASAESSIFRGPGAWWTAVVDSFPRNRNGRRFSVAMLSAVSAYILGLFVISPFSSALIQIKLITLSEEMVFDTIDLSADLPLSLQPNTLDYAQTMAHVLQNVTTSPWLSGRYSVVPFWPYQEERPTGAKIVNAQRSWKANTTVLETEMVYDTLQLVGYTTVMNYTYSLDFISNVTASASTNLTSYIFRSQAGCEYGMAHDPYEPDVTLHGGLYWSSLANVTLADWDVTQRYPGGDASLLLNHTTQCGLDAVFIIILPDNATMSSLGYLFRPSYYSATLPVTVIPGSDATVIGFDKALFNQLRKPVTLDFINTTSFDEIFLTVKWNNFLTKTVSGNGDGGTAVAGGPANVVAALYEFQLTSLAEDPALPTIADQVRQQFFGRVIQTLLQNVSGTHSLDGSVMRTERRLVVTSVVAFILEAVLLVIVCLLLILVKSARLSKRPLGVTQDVAFVNTIASMIPATQNNRRALDAIVNTDVYRWKQGTDKVSCKLAMRELTITGAEIATTESDPTNQVHTGMAIWNPNVLSDWVLSSLALFLCILTAAVATLYRYSLVHGLSQRAFTYQTVIESNAHTIGTITPYSIVPTLLGVISGLWWGSIEGIFRTVQPYIAMTRRATISTHGSGLSYQSSYLVWASVKSLRRGQWLLALVCAGAFFSQILTISMSALWQPVSSIKNITQTLDQPFQLREVPRLYVASDYHDMPQQQILPDVFQNFTTNWLYGAFSQLTVNASEPTWSRDGWSFVPVSFTGVDLAWQESKLPRLRDDLNVTVTVPAIRGRLECSEIAPGLDAKYYSSKVNISGWNATTKPLPPSEAYYMLGCGSFDDQFQPNVFVNFYPNTTIANEPCSFNQTRTALLTAQVPPTCCEWDEDGLPEEAIFSYWTPVIGPSPGEHDVLPYSGFDIVVKTFYGSSPASYDGGDFWNYLVWSAPPDLVMLRCTPIIEAASSIVTIDVVTEKVQSYTIESTPEPFAPAWTHNYLQHQLSPDVDFDNFENNYTVSFGPMFLSALMGAAQVKLLGGCGDESGASCFEQSYDQTFNYHAPGMNMDYMSYAMLSMASYNISAILDPARTIPLAQRVFSVFFQHFVSDDVPTNGSGGWAYQKASEMLPPDLLPAAGQTSNPNAKISQASPSIVTAIISIPIEELQMSPLAVYLCLTILVWLLVTTILVLALKKRYFSALLQPTLTIADVARLVLHSDSYLELAREKGATGLKEDKTIRTKLGWFRSRSGEVTWGIELADDPRVDWLSEMEVKELQLSRGKG